MHSSEFPHMVVVLAQGCHVGIIALSGLEDHLLYSDPLVDYDLRYKLMSSPSSAMLEVVHFMHKAAYTHVIIQQVRCATSGRSSVFFILLSLARKITCCTAIRWWTTTCATL